MNELYPAMFGMSKRNSTLGPDVNRLLVVLKETAIVVLPQPVLLPISYGVTNKRKPFTSPLLSLVAPTYGSTCVELTVLSIVLQTLSSNSSHYSTYTSNDQLAAIGNTHLETA